MAHATLDEFQVIVLSASGSDRDPIGKVLRGEGLTPSFVTDLSKVPELLVKTRAATLLHDWSAVDPGQGAQLHQRLARMDEHANLCRIVYAQLITPQLVALAADTSIRRLISYQTTILNLVGEIKMALTSARNMHSLQTLIHRANTQGTYTQDSVDDTVRQAHESFPHDPVVTLEFANLCLREDDLPQSKLLAERLLKKQPANVRAMNLLARILMKQGLMSEATRILESANGLSPFSAERLMMLGEAFLKQGDNKKAGDYYGQAVEIDPENPNALKGLGTSKLNDGDVNAALELLKNSASEEEAAGLFNNAAVQAAKSGKDEDSLKLYQSALQVLKTDKLKPAVYFNVALALARMGHYKEAHTAVRRALKYDGAHEKANRLKDRLEQLKDWNGQKPKAS